MFINVEKYKSIKQMEIIMVDYCYCLCVQLHREEDLINDHDRQVKESDPVVERHVSFSQ